MYLLCAAGPLDPDRTLPEQEMLAILFSFGLWPGLIVLVVLIILRATTR